MTMSRLKGTLSRLSWPERYGDRPGMTDGQLLQQFATLRDSASFEALVHRHGPMVLGVCYRVLGNRHDAEDAFQATFLVLVRKADSLRKDGVLANWLYGVAYRTALKARAAAQRRRTFEKQVANIPDRATHDARDNSELLALLDAELSLLPNRYRLSVVLCDLQGLTRVEAAHRLGAARKARSRRGCCGLGDLLARRLTRREGDAVGRGADNTGGGTVRPGRGEPSVTDCDRSDDDRGRTTGCCASSWVAGRARASLDVPRQITRGCRDCPGRWFARRRRVVGCECFDGSRTSTRGSAGNPPDSQERSHQPEGTESVQGCVACGHDTRRQHPGDGKCWQYGHALGSDT